MNPVNVMWTEKYRPSTLKEIIGASKDKIKRYLDKPSQMQHLLLTSITPGTGKTSMAKIIVNELNADKIVLNSSDDRKIDTVREKVTDFVRAKSSQQNMRRIVIMDEADGLTPAAQDALRNLMETYSTNAIFILTCNKKSKILPAIQSRCVQLEFSSPDKAEIAEYLSNICESENVEYTIEGLQTVIEKNYPSIRNCVQTLQSLYTEGKSVTVENSKHSDEEFQKLWTIATVDKDWKKVKEYVFKNNIDIRELNKTFWFKAVENNNVKIMQITAANEDRFTRGGEELIIFVTSLLEITK